MNRHLAFLTVSLGLSAAAIGCGGGSSSTPSCDRLLEAAANWYVLDSDVPAGAPLTVDVTFRLKSTATQDAVFHADAADTLQVWSTPSATDLTASFTASPASQTAAPGQNFAYSFKITLGATDTNLGLRPNDINYGTMMPSDLELVSSCIRL